MIVEQPSWNIQDSTKIQSFMDCPRSYFYEYVLGWRSETPNVHLEFGKAWHLAMEHLILTHGIEGEYTKTAILNAYQLFLDYYRQFFSEAMDETNHPKSPGFALKALAEYCKEYDSDSFTPLYTEIAGTVPIAANKLLHFRMDSILRTGEEGHAETIRSREHKTGSQLSRVWTDQWTLKVQTGTYNHVLYCLYPEREVYGVEINGTIFNKTKIQFQRVPARRTKESMRSWFWNINHWFNMITWEFERLGECKESDPVMMCFPMNTESCTKYFGCKYHDFCRAWANPLQNIDEPPQGFMIEYWNPAEEEKEAKHIFRLEGGEKYGE